MWTKNFALFTAVLMVSAELLCGGRMGHFLVSSAWANSAQEEAARQQNMQKRYADFQEQCVQRKWHEEYCKYTQTLTSLLKYENTDKVYPHAMKAAEWLGEMKKDIKMGINPLSKSSLNDYEKIAYLAQIEDEIQKVAEDQNLNDCGRACLAKCASATLVDYVGPGRLNTMTIDDILWKGEGVCTEFTMLGRHLEQSLGIETKIITSSDHAFLKVKIKDKWFYTEPQSPKCLFYPVRDQ